MFVFLILFVVYFNLQNVASARYEDKLIQRLSTESSEPSNAQMWSANQIYSFWKNSPVSHVVEENNSLGPHRLSIRIPHSITKLAKTVLLEFNPYFHKTAFEPFERRPKPVTLVGIRKNGLFPRIGLMHETPTTSTEVAELQSPFNEVGDFWFDDIEAA